MYIAPIVLIIGYIGETRIRFFELSKGQYRGKTFVNDEEKSYIAGFLDGDGSIMAQLVRRKGYKLGFQIRISVVFYQKNTHQDFLLWLKKQLDYGYVRNRKDGMTEYTIVGMKQVENVLIMLYPFLHLKKELARDVLRLIKLHPSQAKMTPEKLVQLSYLVDKTALYNYSKKRTNKSSVVIAYLSESHKLSP